MPGVKGDTSKSVFFVIPYDVANLEDYKPYVAGYVIPQMDGSIREGVLRSYSLYLNRYYAGRAWGFASNPGIQGHGIVWATGKRGCEAARGA
jgi:hypothetical protein